MTLIPNFSALKINQISDYIRFRNVKNYIQSKSKLVKNSQELMAFSGYKNYTKFLKRRKDFDDCRRDIPLAYLEAIGVDVHTLEFCQELDLKEFEYTKEFKYISPSYATIRYMPAIYGNQEFPPNTTESEAIEILLEHCGNTNLQCMINYPGFKTVLVTGVGIKVRTVFYPPEFTISEKNLQFSWDGSNVGQTRFG